MAKLAFCGLGAMGAPMAARLLDAGHEVTVWNRTAARADPLVARGARSVRSPLDAARGAEMVLTMLRDGEALEDVLFGDEGIAASSAGTLIDLSTIGPVARARIASRLDGIEMVDAPVLGSIAPAERGELTVCVGARDETFARVRDLLSTFGTVLHAGQPGAGDVLKLVSNSILLAGLGAVGEGLALADGYGLSPQLVLDVLERGIVGGLVKYKRAQIESGDFSEPQFTVELAAKDARLVGEAAAAGGLNAGIAGAVRAWLDAAAARDPARDFAAVVDEVRRARRAP